MGTINTRVQPMEHFDWDKLVGVTSAIAGGMFAFIHTQFLDASYFVSVLKSSGIALVCGFMGVAGKHAFSMAKIWWIKRKKNK
jgi:hypothetical protein